MGAAIRIGLAAAALAWHSESTGSRTSPGRRTPPCRPDAHAAFTTPPSRSPRPEWTHPAGTPSGRGSSIYGKPPSPPAARE